MPLLLDDLPAQPAPIAQGRGAPRLLRAERRQVELRAITLDELIAPDHVVRLIWQIVQRFDLQSLIEPVAAREGRPGRPQSDPAVLVALWLYATLEGVGSARELARLCHQHHAYRWLCGGISVNYHSLSDFRLAHSGWLDDELARGLAGLMASGAVTLETVAQDGLRVRAAAGSSSFRRKPRLEMLLAAAQQRVQTLKARLAHVAQDRRSRQQAAEERAARERLARVEAALAAMPQAEARKQRNKGKAEEARVSVTDAEAHVMKMPDGGFRPAYNVQFAAETQHGLVAAVAVTTSGADQDALEEVHAQVMDRHGQAPANWLADGGYVSQEGIETVSERGSHLHAPVASTLAKRDSPALRAWRERMASQAGQALFRLRGQVIEWVNAGARNRGFYGVMVRGAAKVRTLALWQALAHNVSRVLATPKLRAVAWVGG
jgi:transposase